MPDFVRARCRLIPDFWKVAAVCLAMAALFVGVAIVQPPREFEGWAAGGAMIVLWSATPFYWLMARLRGVIELDESGVRWRTAFGGWQCARWDEIESCDARMNSTGGQIAHWKFVVKTRNGAFSWTNSFENANELAPFAARFCAKIPANAEDWPRRFSYRSSENLFVGLAMLFLIAGFLRILLTVWHRTQWNNVGAQIEVYVALYGWPLTALGFVLFGAIILVVPALFALIYWQMALAGWRRRDEVFVATTCGLSWRVKGRERLFAAWDELQIWHVEARGPLISLPYFRLESARGEFHWNGGLCGSSQFGRALFERAPQLKRVVQARLREELDDAAHANLSATGERIEFNFRTRSLRAVTGGGAFFCLFFWGVVLFGPLQPANGSAPVPTWISFILAVAATVATLCGVQLFRCGAIVLETRGIRWRLPLRPRFVAWEEIDALIVDRGLYLQVGARRVPLVAGGIYPTHLDLLLETIAARATNAGGAWKSADETARAKGTE